ncbi:MAG TPA: M56 family metallopeptidase [Vicinamibacterales bacterium]|nr:M56 family metallopeptidase [Vicinamibacterales bacterium]
MTIASLPNLAAVAVQIACVALLAGALIWALRITSAGLSYALWRGVFFVCLVLPWIQTPRTATDGAVLVSETATAVVSGAVSDAPLAVPVDWSWLIVLALAAGSAVRLLWLGIGVCRLRRLRRCGERARDDEHAELQARVGTHAEVRYAAEIRQPVTFGLRRPVVMLPSSLRKHSVATRDAVLTHELVHVRRCDWANLLVEETVRAIMWFHPVMWWLISRVQFAREEVVDATAVAVTGRRREYLRALLAFADDVPLAPAPAFARRRHLFRRIVLLSTEDLMSARRIVLSAVAVGFVVLIGTWSATGAFPLQGEATSLIQAQPGPVEQRATLVTAGDVLPRRVHRDTPLFPPDAVGERTSASVTLRTVVDEAGNVAEVRLAGFAFRMGEFSATMHGGPGAIARFEQFLQNASFRASSGTRVNAATVRPMLEAFIESAAWAVRQSRYDPPSAGALAFNTVVQFATGQDAIVRDMPISDRVTNDGALRVGGNIRSPRKVKDARPIYPLDAREAGVQGVVIVELRIEPDGRVGATRVLRSIPLLDQAALDAVQQWEFEPTRLNGAPVAVVMTVTVQFMAQ